MIQQIKENGQLTIPHNIRKYLGLRDGDWIEVVIENGNIVVKIIDMNKLVYK